MLCEPTPTLPERKTCLLVQNRISWATWSVKSRDMRPNGLLYPSRQRSCLPDISMFFQQPPDLLVLEGSGVTVSLCSPETFSPRGIHPETVIGVAVRKRSGESSGHQIRDWAIPPTGCITLDKSQACMSPVPHLSSENVLVVNLETSGVSASL